MKYLSILFLAFLFFSNSLFAQSPKKFFKTAETFKESGNYQDAIDNYTKVLELDPNYVKAYVSRANVYVKLNKAEDALADFERASILEPKKEEHSYNAAKLALELKQYENAIKFSNKAIALDKKMLTAYHVKIRSLYYIDKYDEALETANKAVDVKRNFGTYYDKAEILFAKKEYKKSQDFYQLAISKDPNEITGYIGIANAYFEQGMYDQAVNSANSALRHDQRSKDAYWIRSKSYHKKMDYMSAINDLSQIIVLYPNESYINDVFFKRGEIYYDFQQHTTAINDFTKIIDKDPQYYQAYFKRASSYEVIHNYDKAIADYEKLDELGLKDDLAIAMIADAHVRLFELKREDDKPVIVIEEPLIKDKKIHIVKGKEIQTITGRVDDVSPIKSFKINNVEVVFDSTSKKNEFVADVVVKDKTEITFVASDVYDNVRTNKFPILRTEVDPPQILLVQPFASDDGQIYLESESQSLYIEGTIMDDSRIASITIDSVNASYIPSTMNPSFAATISIANKNKITFIAIDIFGNTTTKEFLINREGAQIAADNPMGKTWVVFIENSKYETFASLNGPTKDISMMKAALAKYRVNNIIHKRNMTKQQMQKFFSIELRDMVTKNRVSSIIVWYAGHGKYLNNSGYWIPVDGKTDDEFTYFNITALKAAMQSYNDVITHTLVITDACESGPSFYQAMRGGNDKIRDCGDWKATKFKSSQVFSSAGYELASDNSQFTKTFANSLIHNPNSCIPIESIVKKVRSAVAKNKQQEPQFGKIDGLADENGTFFFMRK